MKVLKFRDYLVPLVLERKKTSTWRLFDDKSLAADDKIQLYEFGKDIPFGNAKITKVIEKLFADLTVADKEGHEVFSTDDEMYKTYSEYYKTPVGPSTTLKIIWFELII